jgi:chorismate lyase / 3-hydroxybenzoate synthase
MTQTPIDIQPANAANARLSTSAMTAQLPSLRTGYEFGNLDAILADSHVLAVFGFGPQAPSASADARYLRVSLTPLDAPPPFEVWRVVGPVSSGVDKDLRWASDGVYSFGALEVDEASHGGIAAATQYAYQRLSDSLSASAMPHLLRCWNYLDAINLGSGDDERYRQFCNGRAAGMQAISNRYPAATAIGVRDGRRTVQLYWLSARAGGVAFENPRQVSAWRYPRQYGPTPPSFARAMRAPTTNAQIYISGTAAVVGHVSHHGDDFAAQLDETLTNLHSVLSAVGVDESAHFGANCLLKAYVRRDEDVESARERLRSRLPDATPLLLLQGDICRSELLIEIDGVQS